MKERTKYYATLPDFLREDAEQIIRENCIDYEKEINETKIATCVALDFLSWNAISDIYIKTIDLYNSYNISGGTIDYKILDSYNFLKSLGVSQDLLERVKDIEVKLESDFDSNNFNYYSLYLDGSCNLDNVSESELDYLNNLVNTFNNDFQNSISKNVDDILVEAEEVAVNYYIDNDIAFYTFSEEDGLNFYSCETDEYENFLHEVELAKKQLLVNRLNRQLNNKSNIVKKVNKI